LVKTFEYETEYFEYTDSEGNKRIGRGDQKYIVERGFYGGEIMSRRKVGVVYFDKDEDDDYVDGVPDKRRNCPHCAQFDLIMKLGVRRTPKGKPIPSDNDLFLECYHCGNIFPKHEIERQKTLKSDTKQHKVESEFEVGESIIESIPSRSSPAGKKALEKRRRERNRAHHKDKEIDELLRIYGEDRVKIVYDSNP
jgi:hypothetical protein